LLCAILFNRTLLALTGRKRSLRCERETAAKPLCTDAEAASARSSIHQMAPRWLPQVGTIR
jgi:hypothetical protein